MRHLALFPMVTLICVLFFSGFATHQQKRQSRPSEKSGQQEKPIKQIATSSQQPAVDFRQVSEAVAKSVSNSTIRQFVLCNIQPAIWGGYDIVVKVRSDTTVDGKPRTYQIKGGKFTEETSSENIRGLANREGNGHVKLENQQEAFKKGIPFFITSVTFETPSVLHCTVVSNPSIKVDKASLRIEEREGSLYSAAVDEPHSFSSDPGAQQLTFKQSSPLGDKPSIYLSVVSYIDEQNWCLASNEVDLVPILKAIKTK